MRLCQAIFLFRPVLAFRELMFAHSAFCLQDRDRVVFYDNSIDEQPLYTVFIETYVVMRWQVQLEARRESSLPPRLA